VTASVTDPRAHDLRRRYGELFGGSLVPMPVEEIAEDAPAGRRFTLAHELGHWVCQCLEGTEAPVFCRAEEVGLDPEVKALEREADAFAAELLMPEDEVRAAWGGDPDATAARFGVSGEAMRWRLSSLGLGEAPA
jgi:Zn-dependent peptidase ImmA (M78 family)